LAGVEVDQLAELLAAADVGLEPGRVLAAVERAGVFVGAAGCVAPAKAVDAAPVLSGALLDHSWITSLQSERGHAREVARLPMPGASRLEQLAEAASGFRALDGHADWGPAESWSGRRLQSRLFDPPVNVCVAYAQATTELRGTELAAPDRPVHRVCREAG